jgi:hypothetical protein
MTESDKANFSDSLYLLLFLICEINNDNIESAKTRIKEYGYIAEPKSIFKLINYIKEL